MTKAEREIRENIIINNINNKLNMVRNELIPYYGNITLKELEGRLWSQYLTFTNKAHKVFWNYD